MRMVKGRMLDIGKVLAFADRRVDSLAGSVVEGGVETAAQLRQAVQAGDLTPVLVLVE